MTRRLLVPLMAAVFLLVPAAAGAAPVTIDGDPLNVAVDERAYLQARFDGRDTGEFYPPGSEVASAGFHLAIFDASGEATLYGPAGSTFTPQDSDQDGEPDGPVFLPPGPGDPTKRVALTYTAGGVLRVEQIIEYRDGDREFTAHHFVTNISGEPVRFVAAEYADLYLTGSDLGTGFLDTGPPRIVGGISPNGGTGGGLVERSPTWSAYEANRLGTVNSHLSNPGGPALDGTIVKEVVDNAVAVQWDNHKAEGLAPRGQTTFTTTWRFGEFEVPPPPPVAGESVNVRPTGVVRIKYPRGFTPQSAGGARAAQSGFVRVTRAVQIPVGSIVDVRRGAVDMEAAANLTGATQSGNFSKGTFKVKQRRTARPLTELALTGGSFRSCRRGARRSTARTAARRIRRLRGSASGRFRSRGRRSSATVRGTIWTVEDRCDGTLTSVQEGSVTVRDFRRRRNVIVRAGRRYLAR